MGLMPVSTAPTAMRVSDPGRAVGARQYFTLRTQRPFLRLIWASYGMPLGSVWASFTEPITGSLMRRLSSYRSCVTPEAALPDDWNRASFAGQRCQGRANIGPSRRRVQWKLSTKPMNLGSGSLRNGISSCETCFYAVLCSVLKRLYIVWLGNCESRFGKWVIRCEF